MKLLIRNGRVVHPVTGAVLLQDILIEDGKISLMERGIDAAADQVIEAAGLAVSPGLVDMHVHLRDPGLTYKEDILTGCAAAAAARNFFLLHGNIVEGQLELINGVVNDFNDARADSAGVSIADTYSRRGSGSGFCRSRGFLLALCLFLIH